VLSFANFRTLALLAAKALPAFGPTKETVFKQEAKG
jgi:hypothetical protein